jgi:hypothetical protein
MGLLTNDVRTRLGRAWESRWATALGCALLAAWFGVGAWTSLPVETDPTATRPLRIQHIAREDFRVTLEGDAYVHTLRAESIRRDLHKPFVSFRGPGRCAVECGAGGPAGLRLDFAFESHGPQDRFVVRADGVEQVVLADLAPAGWRVELPVRASRDVELALEPSRAEVRWRITRVEALAELAEPGASAHAVWGPSVELDGVRVVAGSGCAAEEPHRASAIATSSSGGSTSEAPVPALLLQETSVLRVEANGAEPRRVRFVLVPVAAGIGPPEVNGSDGVAWHVDEGKGDFAVTGEVVPDTVIDLWIRPRGGLYAGRRLPLAGLHRATLRSYRIALASLSAVR